jgi:superoxide dismutase
LNNLIKTFNATTAAIQGSGWGWLVSCRSLFEGLHNLLFVFLGLKPHHRKVGDHDNR